MPIVAYPFTDQQFSSTKLTPASDIKTPLNNTLNEVLMNSGCILKLPIYLFYTSLINEQFVISVYCCTKLFLPTVRYKTQVCGYSYTTPRCGTLVVRTAD